MIVYVLFNHTIEGQFSLSHSLTIFQLQNLGHAFRGYGAVTVPDGTVTLGGMKRPCSQEIIVRRNELSQVGRRFETHSGACAGIFQFYFQAGGTVRGVE